MGEFNGQRVRFLKKVEVHEISPVLLGAGLNTRTIALKQSELRINERQAWILHERFKELTKKRYRETEPGFCETDRAWILAKLAAKELGVELRAIRFFRECEPFEHDLSDFTHESRILGKADARQKTIWLDENLKGSELLDVIGHEVFHLSQPTFVSEGSRAAEELEADSYGKAFAAKFGNIRSGADLYAHGSGDWDRRSTYHQAQKGAMLIHLSDGWIYERFDFAWHRKRQWRQD